MSPVEGAPITLVKFGGSLITDKERPGRARPEVVARLAREVAGHSGSRRLLLGHGSGSFGHAEAARYGLEEGMSAPRARRGVAATQRAAAKLHAIVVDALLDAGVEPLSLSPSSYLVAADRQPVSVATAALEEALRRGLLPVTHGDVVMDRHLGACICSTETALLALTRCLLEAGWRVDGAVWCGDTAGVLDDRGRTIPHVRAGEAFPDSVGGSTATDVTGGMRHRLETAVELARLGVVSRIVDGAVPGLLAAALAGEKVPGTRLDGS